MAMDGPTPTELQMFKKQLRVMIESMGNDGVKQLIETLDNPNDTPKDTSFDSLAKRLYPNLK